MARPQKLESPVVDAWLADHAGWSREEGAIARAYRFADFAAALAFTVRVGMIAEKRDHHPDVLLGWGKARVTWTTHDAGGITRLDLDLAEATDAIASDLRPASEASKD
ncbi:MAG: 4a-hydroxytetrahydrobiopterin dehydratase [Labilithrix sp.]|nr:4a-hydroxytetrahydrobiopterin dehydratase [Labilithrix sp.]